LNSLRPLTFILSPLGRGQGEGTAKRGVGLALVLLLLLPVVAFAQDAAEIVRKADLVRAPVESFIWDVTITTYEGSKAPTVNGFEVYVKGVSKTFVKFVSPARNVGRSLLGLDRDLWIYLPDAGKPVRIPLSQRLVGQVANGDVARTNYSGDYTATLAGSERVDGVDCYVLALKAKSKEITYAAIKYWVAKETFHPVKAEFYAGTGTLLKTGTFEEYKESGGRLRPTRLTLVDAIRKDVKSTMDFGNIRIRDLPDKYFNKTYMKTLD
jgi:outer membrane lipoprotein-sorting protein